MSSNKDERNDKNNKNANNYDRRPIVDPPSDKHVQHAEGSVSAKRKGFYIILLLGITAIGIYAVISALLPHNTAKKPNDSTSAAFTTTAPDYKSQEESVPANANGTPVDESEPMTDDEINNQSEKSKSTEQATGSTIEPAQPPVSGKIVKDFSDSELVYSKTMKDWRTHEGVDIATNPDTIVTAIKDGILKKVYEDSLFGTTVVIHHSDDGTDSVYCNLKDATSEPIGSEIKTGDVLGKVGKSAVSEIEDEPHLHFEIKKDEKFLDPKLYVKFEEVDYLPKTSPSPNPSAAKTNNETAPQSSLTPNSSASAMPKSSQAPNTTQTPYPSPDPYAEDTIYID